MTVAGAAGAPAVRSPRRASGTNQEAIRRHNLGTLLHHLHLDGPLSRAELTQRMALNRSTIGGLVQELEELGAVRQKAPTGSRAGAGRPSLDVHPRRRRFTAVAVDLRVDEIRVALVGVTGKVLERRVAAMPPTRRADRVAVTTARLIADAVTGRHGTVVGVGVGVPGAVSRHDGLVRSAPNLGWHDVPFADLLGRALQRRGEAAVERLPRPVVANDADLGALAEHARGVGTGVDDLVYLSGDVGVGGGLVIDGTALHGDGGFAGEIGHLGVRRDGRRCRCGATGCWETEVGADAIASALGRPAGEHDGLTTELRADGPVPSGVAEPAYWLGHGLGMVANVLNPRLLILGGLLGDLYVAATLCTQEAFAASAMAVAGERARIVRPALGDDVVLLGAAERALQPLFVDPCAVAG